MIENIRLSYYNPDVHGGAAAMINLPQTMKSNTQNTALRHACLLKVRRDQRKPTQTQEVRPLTNRPAIQSGNVNDTDTITV